MRDQVLKSGWETFLFAIPFLGILLVGLFRLDELISSPKRRRKTRKRITGVDHEGEPVLSDPDGRPWRVKKGRK